MNRTAHPKYQPTAFVEKPFVKPTHCEQCGEGFTDRGQPLTISFSNRLGKWTCCRCHLEVPTPRVENRPH